jgi:hypothetical protein
MFGVWIEDLCQAQTNRKGPDAAELMDSHFPLHQHFHVFSRIEHIFKRIVKGADQIIAIFPLQSVRSLN